MDTCPYWVANLFACWCGLLLVDMDYYWLYCLSVWAIYWCGLLLVDVGYRLSVWATTLSMWAIACQCGLSLISVGYYLSMWAIARRCGLLLVGVGYCLSVWAICRCGLLLIGVGYCSPDRDIWASEASASMDTVHIGLHRRLCLPVQSPAPSGTFHRDLSCTWSGPVGSCQPSQITICSGIGRSRVQLKG